MLTKPLVLRKQGGFLLYLKILDFQKLHIKQIKERERIGFMIIKKYDYKQK